MILLKSFFRNKNTKVYLVILTFLLVSLTVVTNYISYYSNIITKTYDDNSYFMVVSDKDIYDDIEKVDEVKSIDRAIPFECDSKSEFLLENNLICFDLYDQNNNYLIGILEENEDLLGNQISLSIPKNVIRMLNNKEESYNQKISLKLLNNIYEYNIKDINDNKFFRIKLSSQQFNKILNESLEFGFILKSKKYDDINSIEEKLSLISGVKTARLIQSIDSESTFNSIKELKTVISTLKYGSIFFGFLIFVLFLIFINNIIKEEKERMNMEILLGYNKLQIKKILVLKILLFNIFILFLSIGLYLLVNLIIQIIGGFNFFDILSMFGAFCFLTIISLSFCLILKIKIRQ